jgi:hypothetical protein
MKTYVHLWWYLAEFFFQREMFQTKVIEKFKFDNCFPKMAHFMKYCEKCGGTMQAIDDNIIRLVCFESWITKVTQTGMCDNYFFPRQQSLHERTSVLVSYAHFLFCCLSCTLITIKCFKVLDKLNEPKLLSKSHAQGN